MDKDAKNNRQSKGCGRCRERKVLCDRTRPSCLRCSKRNKPCDGYGLRLSWPRRKDRKRAMIAPVPPHEGHNAHTKQIQFINVSAWDMKFNERAGAEGSWPSCMTLKRSPLKPGLLAPLYRPLRWMAYDLNPTESSLIDYFGSVVSSSLPVLGDDNSALRNTLARMALSFTSASTVCVLQSILALASLHMNGFQPQAIRYHLSALRTLRETVASGLDRAASCQHVAAIMLLGTFESYLVQKSITTWVSYICNARSLMTSLSSSAQGKSFNDDSDYTVLVGWMHYQHAVGSFSVLHWIHDDNLQLEEPTFDRKVVLQKRPPAFTALCDSNGIPHPGGPAHKLLFYLSMLMGGLVDPSDPEFHTSEHQDYLASLEKDINSIQISDPDTESSFTMTSRTSLTRLYQVAILIYLERCGRNVTGECVKVSKLADEGFDLLYQRGECRRPFFPLLILGCEARSDAQRSHILDLISDAHLHQGMMRNLVHLERMIKFMWVHDDLGSKAPSHLARIQAMFSICETIPTFH